MTDFVTGTAGLGHSLQASAGRVSVPGGACIWLTGLSGAGKSTTAQLVAAMLESGGRCVTLLDGDVVRELLSPDLGFSRSDRDANVRRIGFVAREIVRHGGMAVCAAISPYRATRAEVRAMVGSCRFVEVYVDCPLEVCEARDPKGLYAQARAGLIPAFTGISAPYEPPERAEVVISTASTTVQANAIVLLRYLASTGLLVGSVLDDGSPLPIPSSSPVDDTDRRSSNDQRIPMR